MATSPFSGAGLSQFGQEMSRPGIFDAIGDKLKKFAGIALLNGTGATGFLDNLLPGAQNEMGVPPPQVTPIKQQPIVPTNYIDNSGQLVSFNPYTKQNPSSPIEEEVQDHVIGKTWLDTYK